MGLTLTSIVPADPHRNYSFTDHSTYQSTQPQPGDRLDAEFDQIYAILSDIAASLNVITARPQITLDDLAPGVQAQLVQAAVQAVQPLLAQIQSASANAIAQADRANREATRSQGAANAAASTVTELDGVSDELHQALADAGGWSTEAENEAIEAQNAANDAEDAATRARRDQELAGAWAEYLEGGNPIPPSFFADTAITGNHWSARWWAAEAAGAFGSLAALYQGALPSPPTSTITGKPLPIGAIYYDTTSQQPYVWDGDSWNPFYAPTKALMSSLLYSATANQTSLNLNTLDLNGQHYTVNPAAPEPLDLFLNGVRVPRDAPVDGTGDWDFNPATNTVTFLKPLLAGTIIHIDILSPVGGFLSGGTLTGPLTNGAIAETASDLVPSRHLSNLIGKTSAVVAIIGDSTATAGPDQVGTAGGQLAANGVDPSQMIWAGLCDKLRTDNPQITNWTFLNFAIGGTAENAPTQIGSALGVPLPPWFTNPSQTWLSYVQAAQPDVLFYLFGTNASAAGTGAGAGPATFIQDNLTVVEAWPTTPNIIMVTNKTSTPDDTTPGPDDLASSNHLGQASFHRTFAKTNASGYTAFPKCVAKGFGLVDLGRYAASRLYGYDPAVQYMRAIPSAIVTGKPLTTGATSGVDASTVGKSTHGDFRLTFVLRGQGGTTLSNYGFAAIRVGMSNFGGNYVRITVEPGGVGTLRARYVLDGATASVPLQSGSLVTTTTGQDVVITVSASGSRIRTWINGTLAQDIAAPRFVTPTYGGCPINVNITSDPVGSPTIDITEFYEGIGTPTMMTTDYNSAFGTHDQGNALTDGYQGGNSINHQTSLNTAHDRRVIAAMNFSVPNNNLQYDSAVGKLFYFVGGAAKFSIDNAGNVRAAGTITPSVTP